MAVDAARRDAPQQSQVRPSLTTHRGRRAAGGRTRIPRRATRGHRRRGRRQRTGDLPPLPQQGSAARRTAGRHQHPTAGRRHRRRRPRRSPAAALDGLIDFHLDFAFDEPDLIRIQDRDLGHLPATARRQVRKAQRQYVEIWVDVLRRLDGTLNEADARLMAHATFGLLNSTPHSVKPGVVSGSSRAVLRAMTLAALNSARGR